MNTKTLSAIEAALRLTLALWVGGIAVFTFLVTPAIFGHYPRQEAGRVVGVLFPLYFPYLTVLSALALAGFLALRRGAWRRAHAVALGLFLTAVAANGVNQFAVHPRARALKARMHSGGSPAARDAARHAFGRLHGASTALNLLVLADGVVLVLGGSRWWRSRPGPP